MIPKCSEISSFPHHRHRNHFLFLPVIVQTSPEVDDLTAHLLYSMILSFHQQSRTNTYRSSSSSSSSSSLLFPKVLKEQLRRIASLVLFDENNSTKNFNRNNLLPNIEIRPCIHLIRLPRLSTTTSSSYHQSLERKLRALTEIVVNGVKQQQQFESNKIMMMNWMLILDADTQVFPGWFEELILPKIGIRVEQEQEQEQQEQYENRNTDAATRSSTNTLLDQSFFVNELDYHVSRIPSMTRESSSLSPCSSLSSSFSHNYHHHRLPAKIETMYFQREARGAKHARRDKINTGVILLNRANRLTRAIFLEANKTFERRKGGDQTAIQRILRWYIDSSAQVHPGKTSSSPPPRYTLMTKYINFTFPTSFVDERETKNKKNNENKNKDVVHHRHRRHHHTCTATQLFGLCEDDDVKLMNSKSCFTTSHPTIMTPFLSEEEADAFDYDVFDKRLVNAGVIDAQRDILLIHHAHMSGKFKRKNLRETFEYRQQKKNKTKNVTSPPFLSSSSLEDVCQDKTGQQDHHGSLTRDENAIAVENVCGFFFPRKTTTKNPSPQETVAVMKSSDNYANDELHLNKTIRQEESIVPAVVAASVQDDASSFAILLVMVVILAGLFLAVILRIFGGGRRK